MATNWPSSRDSFTNPSASDALDSVLVPHADQHANINDAVEALQAHAGLVLVSTTTIGSGVSSVTVNNCFSSTFDNYRITLTDCVGSTALVLRMTFDSISSGYYWSYQQVDLNGTSAGGGTGATSVAYLEAGRLSGNAEHTSIEVGNASIARRASIVGQTVVLGLANTGRWTYAGWQSSATAHTSFTLTTSTGTMTGGTIRVYGYNNG